MQGYNAESQCVPGGHVRGATSDRALLPALIPLLQGVSEE